MFPEAITSCFELSVIITGSEAESDDHLGEERVNQLIEILSEGV
ncbi:MAG: hypothetical protein U5L09_16870 [Bacteroidales bacterium]|nr:hypothetical protein [Bacteroidales bacterium]